MRNKEWIKHHKKDKTTANRMTVFLFLRSRNRGMATGNLPLCFKKQTSVVKFPWPFRGSCLVKKNTHTHTPSLDSSWFGRCLWCFCHCLFLIGNFAMVDSPRFPKSSGIDPKKALLITTHLFILAPAVGGHHQPGLIAYTVVIFKACFDRLRPLQFM